MTGICIPDEIANYINKLLTLFDYLYHYQIVSGIAIIIKTLKYYINVRIKHYWLLQTVLNYGWGPSRLVARNRITQYHLAS